MDYYIVYYKIENVYYYYDGKEFNSTKELYKLKLVQYEIHQSYDKTNDGLFSYHNNMKIWTEEIYESTEFYYLGKYNDIVASLHFFMKYNSKKNIHDFDRIMYDESTWIENCYNGGIEVVFQETHKKPTRMMVVHFTKKCYVMMNSKYHLKLAKNLP